MGPTNANGARGCPGASSCSVSDSAPKTKFLGSPETSSCRRWSHHLSKGKGCCLECVRHTLARQVLMQALACRSGEKRQRLDHTQDEYPLVQCYHYMGIKYCSPPFYTLPGASPPNQTDLLRSFYDNMQRSSCLTKLAFNPLASADAMIWLTLGDKGDACALTWLPPTTGQDRPRMRVLQEPCDCEYCV